ncbi:receptor like protein 21 [Cajanus cajan]|uniref:receptor like protein 21 n=1 Tax=Cajanus cajan TaxID=3821 RepID=UPI00098D76E0|nr:receptor like protein 21 [Cajanus cajan]
MTRGLCKLKSPQALNLGTNHFVGHLPSCLANFSSFRVFDVSQNNFEGTFPFSLIYNLKSLAYVSLNDNHFKGTLSFSLLANHSDLQVLDIGSYNQQDFKIDTENPPFVPSFQLKILRVINCTLNEPSHMIPTFLYNQHELRMLDIGPNSMKGRFPNWLLENNTKLDFLNLSNNHLIGPIELNATTKFSNMHILDVSCNPIGEIPPNIGSLFPNLVTLNMSSSSLHGSFPASLGDMRQLNNLDLSHNNLFGHIPQEFGKGSNDLRFLRLSNNNLHGPFLPFGSNFTKLLSLHQANNNFKGSIPDGIMNNTELRMLDLSNNQLHGEIPSWIGSFQYLTFLILSQNLLEGPIPMGFCKLTNLAYVDISQNSLNGTLPKCVNMPDLRYLYLQNNKFSGPIPTFLTNSSFLLTMNLVDNKFSGQIPWWISSLLNLRILLLKKNKLDGLIPIDVCQLKNISIMDLSQNNFSRSIPPCLNNISFGRLDSLAAKVLGKFVVPWVTRSTEYVFWSDTNTLIEGENIQDFAEYDEQDVVFMSKSRYETYKGNILDLMSGLDLSSNKLTGQIPSQMGYLNSIHTLNLSNNHLTGPMPETFSSLKQIESLDLSCNRLSGHIPSQLTDLYHLSVFSVAHNDFSGRTLERVNQFATFEASSYEGNTLLCGPPLNRSCSSVVKQPAPGIGTSPLGKNEFRDTFVYSFPPPFCVAFVSVIAFRYFNSYFKVPYKNKFCV